MKDHKGTWGDAAFQAAQNGGFSEVVVLLEQNADPDAPDRHGFTALSRAAQYDRLYLIRILLDAGAQPNAPCKWGLTPLMAVKSVAAAEALLRAGADVNAVTLPNKSGMEPDRTALMKAAMHERLDVVEALRACGADLEMRDAEGRSALILAAAGGNSEVAEALIRAGAKVGLVEAALLGDLAKMRALLGEGGDIPSEFRDSALWWAAGNGQAEAVRLLLEAGASVDARGSRGMTALMNAALQGQTEIVDLLLARGADVDAVNGRGGSALHFSVLALQGRKEPIVRALLEAGAEVDARTGKGWPIYVGATALIEAALKGATECVRALIEHGADVDAVCDFDEDGVGGGTALSSAVLNSRLDVVRLLLESGADVNNRGRNDRRPLALARQRALQKARGIGIIDLLVNAGGTE